jgi:hypothetical protein
MVDNSLQIMVQRIWLQGEEALVPILPISEDGIRYRVPGLDSNLEIKDNRAVGRSALQAAYTIEGARDFHRNFDSPALVTIHANGNRTVVELDEPTHPEVDTYDVLWVAALVEESLPTWPMPWCFQAPSQGERRSFVAILE